MIADLTPLSFFHLVEHIQEDGIEAAVVRLYERLGPLLSCRHDWTPLKREEDERMRAIVGIEKAPGAPGPYICKSCTAYALGNPLPLVGTDTDYGRFRGVATRVMFCDGPTHSR